MIRSIYCPSEEYLDEATKLADSFKLPIVIGMCPQLEGIKFDSNLVAVVAIPDAHFLEVSNNPIRVGLAQSFRYINEFIDLPAVNFSIEVEHEGVLSPVSTQLIEKHYVKSLYRAQNAGTHTVIITVDGKKVAETEFEVTE